MEYTYFSLNIQIYMINKQDTLAKLLPAYSAQFAWMYRLIDRIKGGLGHDLLLPSPTFK